MRKFIVYLNGLLKNNGCIRIMQNNCKVNWTEASIVKEKYQNWYEKLFQINGIYLSCDKNDKKIYIGSTKWKIKHMVKMLM